VAVT
ncbi:acrB/AcrD/AcrF family protein, partial [Vibrio parahaemolyticus V-223/04]|jgi:hypothetical protein